MLDRRSLDPEQRTLYGANLQPPAGYVFDAAVATTFSLDFETALTVPVSLALFAAENRDNILSHPLALLEGAERIAGRLVVFTDAGHIQASVRPHSRLCSLLERIIVEVAAPQGGAFHPKMWALRFTPLRPEDPARMRLLILSRNLTRDRSWDIAATLDGVITRQPKAVNRPVADFLRQLSDLATVGVPDGTKALVDDLTEDMRRAEWSLPDPFQSVSFAVNGLGGKPWRPEPCVRLGVVSPFCDDQTLSMLAGLASAEKPIFIGRSDELAQVPGATLDGFARVAVLDEMAATEDGEEEDAAALQGLHAKAFIAERGWDTAITVGSGNATRPALLTGSNVEIFATLTGKRSRVGSVEEILGDKGFGRLTRPFVRDETGAADATQRAAEARLDQARREICRSGLTLRCERGEPRRRWRAGLAGLADPVRTAAPYRARCAASLADHAGRRTCARCAGAAPTGTARRPWRNALGRRYSVPRLSPDGRNGRRLDPIQHRAQDGGAARRAPRRRPALGARQQGRLLPLSPAAPLRIGRSIRRRPRGAGRVR